MIIGVLSDTHRDRRAVERAFRLFQARGASLVFCLGDLCEDVRDREIEFDMEVLCVAGNVDYSSPHPIQRVHEADGIRFFLTHGHTLNVIRSHRDLLEEAAAHHCQVALYGHTHVPFNSREKGILILNPGSAGQPRGGSRASCAVIDTTGGSLRAEVFWLWEDDKVSE